MGKGKKTSCDNDIRFKIHRFWSGNNVLQIILQIWLGARNMPIVGIKQPAPLHQNTKTKFCANCILRSTGNLHAPWSPFPGRPSPDRRLGLVGWSRAKMPYTFLLFRNRQKPGWGMRSTVSGNSQMCLELPCCVAFLQKKDVLSGKPRPWGVSPKSPAVFG